MGFLIPEFQFYHLLLCLLTLFSWFIIGFAVKRPGLFIVTELQQRLRLKLNNVEHMENYVHFMIKKLIGKEFNPQKVDILTQASLYLVTSISIYLNCFS